MYCGAGEKRTSHIYLAEENRELAVPFRYVSLKTFETLVSNI
jgi:hypothetical protein